MNKNNNNDEESKIEKTAPETADNVNEPQLEEVKNDEQENVDEKNVKLIKFKKNEEKVEEEKIEEKKIEEEKIEEKKIEEKIEEKPEKKAQTSENDDKVGEDLQSAVDSHDDKMLKEDKDILPVRYYTTDNDGGNESVVGQEESIQSNEINNEGVDLLNALINPFVDKDSQIKSNDERTVDNASDIEHMLFGQVSDAKIIVTISEENSEMKAEAEEEVDPKQRSELIEKIKDALDYYYRLFTHNDYLQNRLNETLRIIKAKHIAAGYKLKERNTSINFNVQYTRLFEIFQSVVTDGKSQLFKLNEVIERHRTLSEEKQRQQFEMNNEFEKEQELVAASALHSHTGHKLDTKVVTDYFISEQRKENRIKVLRLSNLELGHIIHHLDDALRSTENFEGGLRLIDFEQLKIENQTFNEKVEEKQETSNKLREKIQKCNLLIAHIKEKMSYCENEKKVLGNALIQLTKKFKNIQSSNNRLKKVRAHTKYTNLVLRRSCGLLGNKKFLADYETVESSVTKQRSKILKLEELQKNINKDLKYFSRKAKKGTQRDTQ